MLRMTQCAALIGLLALAGEAQAGTNLNGRDLNGRDLNGTNLNGTNLNGTNLNGAASGRAFLGAHVSALIAPDGTLVTLD